jgi:hypothetical protein
VNTNPVEGLTQVLMLLVFTSSVGVIVMLSMVVALLGKILSELQEPRR